MRGREEPLIWDPVLDLQVDLQAVIQEDRSCCSEREVKSWRCVSATSGIGLNPGRLFSGYEWMKGVGESSSSTPPLP